MSALTIPALPPVLVHAVAALGATAGRLWGQLAEAWRRRHDTVLLASLDDYMLKDMGLTRGDLNDALAEPLWRDPTAVLLRRQSERRAGRCRRAAPIARRAAPSIVPDADAGNFPPADARVRRTL